VHIPTFEPGALVLDTGFRPIPTEQIWAERFKTRRGWVDHYWGRSFVEFLQKKQRSAATAWSSTATTKTISRGRRTATPPTTSPRRLL
jgi:hypothetical protein